MGLDSTMKSNKIDSLFQRYEDQRKEIGGLDGEVNVLLVRGLLVNICAEFERILKEMVSDRFSRIDDVGVRNFARAVADKTFKSANIDRFYDALMLFGVANKDRFKELRKGDDQVVASYESIINQRNKAAHGGDVDVTFDEVRQYYYAGHVVLDWFESALRVDVG